MFWLYWGIAATQILWKSLTVDVMLVCAKEAQAQPPQRKAYPCKMWCQLMTGYCRSAQIPGAQSPRRLNFLQYVFAQHDSWPCWTLHQTSSSKYHATLLATIAVILYSVLCPHQIHKELCCSTTDYLFIKVLLPTDVQNNCFKRILKFTLKQLQHVLVLSPLSGSVQFELAKVTFVKAVH